MYITAEQRSIIQLFPNNNIERTKYVIPLYQREYSWSKENVEELLGDIDREENGYYIGNLLVKSRSENGEILEVIDGQQRLTTIALTMIAIRDILSRKKRNNEKLVVLQNMNIENSIDKKDMLKKLEEYASSNRSKKRNILDILGKQIPKKITEEDIFNDKIARKLLNLDRNLRKAYNVDSDYNIQHIDELDKEDKEGIEDKIKNINVQLELKKEDGKQESRLQLLSEDSKIYNFYLGITKSEIDKRKLMVKRFKEINDKLSEMCKSIEEFEQFYDKLMSISILKIKMTDLSDAFNVFSSLNGKGLPLTLLDLLKSEYIRIKSKSSQESVPEKALEKWNNLMNIFKSVKDDQISSKTVTQFLQNNYDTFVSTAKSSITKSNLLKGYTDLFTKDKSDYLNNLMNSAKLFSIISPNIISSKDIKEDSEIKKLIEELQKLDASQAYPLMLYLLNEFQEGIVDKKVIAKVFKYLVNFYVRRNAVSKPKSSNIRSVIIEIIRDLKVKDTKDVIDEELKKLSKMSADDNEFFKSVCGLTYDSDRQLIRFLLINLERKHGTYFDSQIKDTLDESGNHSRTWSLEHILPESDKLSEEWCDMIAPGGKNIEYAQMLQKENMHKFGNLTLTGYNSEMSNGSFISKRDYKKNSEYKGLRTPLYINKSIAGNNKNIKDKESWTIDDINRRTEELSKQVVEDYPMTDVNYY